MSIHEVCRKGNVDGLLKLLKTNCDIDIQNINGDTGLMYACANNHREIVSILLKAKCNVNKTNCIGDTCLIEACRRGNKDIVSMLLRNNCNIDWPNKFWSTAFIQACRKGKKDIVLMLLKKNCDIYQRDSSGFTGPMYARHNKEIIFELVRFGCIIYHFDLKKYKKEINLGLQFRTQLFDTCIRFVHKNMSNFTNKIHLLPRDIRKHFDEKNLI